MTEEIEEHKQMVKDCQKRSEGLTDWEIGFLKSVAGVLSRNRRLTDKQAETLDKIWDKATQNG